MRMIGTFSNASILPLFDVYSTLHSSCFSITLHSPVSPLSYTLFSLHIHPNITPARWHSRLLVNPSSAKTRFLAVSLHVDFLPFHALQRYICINNHRPKLIGQNQSPSPTEERTDPFSALQRARSGGSHKTPPSPSSPINSLHRQLSGDPDHPPPAWQRRSSFRDGKNPSRSPSKSISMSSASASPPLASGQTNNVGGNGMLPNQPVPPNMGGAAHGRTSRSPSDASSASGISGGARPNLPPQTRRHPHLTMTTSTPGLMGNELYSHDSPHGSSSSLHDPVLLPPNPAFAGKGSRGNRSASARSSMHTLNSMTSEELWDAEPDRSNPHRPSQERPLDTVRKDRRNSQASTRNSIMTTPAYQMDMMCMSFPRLCPYVIGDILINRAAGTARAGRCSDGRQTIKVHYQRAIPLSPFFSPHAQPQETSIQRRHSRHCARPSAQQGQLDPQLVGQLFADRHSRSKDTPQPQLRLAWRTSALVVLVRLAQLFDTDGTARRWLCDRGGHQFAPAIAEQFASGFADRSQA